MKAYRRMMHHERLYTCERFLREGSVRVWVDFGGECILWIGVCNINTGDFQGIGIIIKRLFNEMLRSMGVELM